MMFYVHIAKRGRDPWAPDFRFSARLLLMHVLPVLSKPTFLQERQSNNKWLCLHIHEVIQSGPVSWLWSTYSSVLLKSEVDVGQFPSH